jgi:FkbM family methyltransferase
VIRRLKRAVATILANTIERHPGLEQLVHERTESRRLPLALARLMSTGVQIDTVYDIGAHRGRWTESVRPTLPGARFVLFEANDVHALELAATGEPYFIATLSSEERAVDFYGTGGPGDSYFREATAHYQGVSATTVQATTLDRLIERHDLPLPDLIKADVQGAELDVLAGGPNALANAQLVLLECPITAYNEGAPNIDEYFRFMADRAFTPVAFLDPTWHEGEMVQVDVLFRRASD